MGQTHFNGTAAAVAAAADADADDDLDNHDDDIGGFISFIPFSEMSPLEKFSLLSLKK